MIKNILKTIIASALLMALGLLPGNAQVSKGSLKCGAQWYIVPNPAVKGYADFTLVRDDTQGADIFTFPSAKANSEAADSLLMRIFGMMGESRTAQAIIVTGDVNVESMKTKMEIFSMMVSPLGSTHSADNYDWEASFDAHFNAYGQPRGNMETIQIIYSAQRTPREGMDNGQFMIGDIFSKTFCIIAQSRISRSLSREGIPFCDLSVTHSGSDKKSGDETYTIEVCTAKGRGADMMTSLASTLASFDTHGAQKDEIANAKNIITLSLKEEINSPIKSPSHYTDICISNFLFGTPTDILAKEHKFLTSKKMDADAETQIFNDFSSAILDSKLNVSVNYYGSMPSSVMTAAFDKGWEAGSEQRLKGYVSSARDTLGLFDGPRKKIKLKENKADAVSGGNIWRFSNGMTVIYKKMNPGSGLFNYALMSKKGYSAVPGLREGEGGFFSDMLGLYDVAGLNSREFGNMLKSNGIGFETSINANDFCISGSALSGKLNLLMRSLLSITNERSLNRKSFDAYSKNQKLQLSRASVEDEMYSALHPDFTYTPVKNPDMLDESLLEHANMLLDDVLADPASWTIVLCGDLDEENVMKILTRNIGSFPQESPKLRNAPYLYYTPTGKLQLKGDEGQGNLRITCTCDISLSAINIFASHIAKDILIFNLQEALERYGIDVSADIIFETIPQERLSLQLVCSPRYDDIDIESLLPIIRKTLDKASMSSIRTDMLKSRKEYVSNAMTRCISSSEYMTEAIKLRYLAGKNVVQDYAGVISRIDADRIREILSAMMTGGRVEYID